MTSKNYVTSFFPSKIMLYFMVSSMKLFEF